MFMSVLTPGGLSAVMMARVETLSTSVAVNPPCMVPPRLRWDSSTVSSQVHFPGIADTTSSYAVRVCLFIIIMKCFLDKQDQAESKLMLTNASSLEGELQEPFLYRWDCLTHHSQHLATCTLKKPSMRNHDFLLIQSLQRNNPGKLGD